MYECFHCGARAVVWQSDYDFEDYCYEGEGIVHCLHCYNCGADIEYKITTKEVDDMIDEDIKQITDVDELHRLYSELNSEKEKDEAKIKKLETILEDMETLIKSYNPNTLSMSERTLLDSLMLIKNGVIKVYRGEDHE